VVVNSLAHRAHIHGGEAGICLGFVGVSDGILPGAGRRVGAFCAGFDNGELLIEVVEPELGILALGIPSVGIRGEHLTLSSVEFCHETAAKGVCTFGRMGRERF
jgi:hypothetical protein